MGKMKRNNIILGIGLILHIIVLWKCIDNQNWSAVLGFISSLTWMVWYWIALYKIELIKKAVDIIKTCEESLGDGKSSYNELVNKAPYTDNPKVSHVLNYWLKSNDEPLSPKKPEDGN